MFSRFDTIPECDRHTHTDRHTTTAYTALSIASRGNKTGELRDILYKISPDCVFVCESWLHEDICNGLLDPRNEYAIFRKDRLCTKGSGVCALIKHKHAVVPIDLPNKYSDLELLVLVLVELIPVLRVFVIYRPQHYNRVVNIAIQIVLQYYWQYFL